MSQEVSAYGEHEEPIPREEEPERLDPENRCIECGKEIVSACGCCGAPLCSRHQETQAGFCSYFSNHQFAEHETVTVVDSINELSRDKVRFHQSAEVQGCLFSSDDPKEDDILFVMDSMPNGHENPVSELDMDKVEVVE
jgi:hypothetical protein